MCDGRAEDRTKGGGMHTLTVKKRGDIDTISQSNINTDQISSQSPDCTRYSSCCTRGHHRKRVQSQLTPPSAGVRYIHEYHLPTLNNNATHYLLTRLTFLFSNLCECRTVVGDYIEADKNLSYIPFQTHSPLTIKMKAGMCPDLQARTSCPRRKY